MNTTFDVLVIVLSCLLGIFLILSIVTAVLVLKLVSSLRSIIAKGEQMVDNAEALAETLRRNSAAVSVAKLVGGFAGAFNKKRRG